MTDVREAVEKSHSVDVPRPDGDFLSLESPGTLPKDISVREAENWVAIGNIQHTSPDADLSLEDEMTACFELLKGSKDHDRRVQQC